MKQLVSLKEIAATWGCHRTTARRKLATAGIHPIVFGSSRTSMVRYRLEDIEAYLRRCVPDDRRVKL